MAEAGGTINLAALAALQTPLGEELLEEAARYTDPLTAVTAMRRRYPAELVGAAVELTDLRRRAADKIAGAERMFFVREALEQASGSIIAEWRAHRFTGYSSVADWGCGLGMDTLAIANVTSVTGLDLDPLRIALAKANARVLDRGSAVFETADYLAVAPIADAIWADPARRKDGFRVTNPDSYSPPLNRIVRHAAGRPLGVKISPAVALDDLPPETEAEFISVNGALKECVLWFGDLRTCPRRATVLPEGVSLTPSRATLDIGPPASALYDPDPTVLRAGAVKDLGRLLGAWQMDSAIAYLTGSSPIATPFAQTLLIEAVMPWNLKAVKRHLRGADQRVEEIRKRASAVDVEAARRALKTDGSTPVILVLTRVEDRPTAIIATRWKG